MAPGCNRRDYRNDVVFHLIPYFEGQLLGVTANCDIIYWELHGTFPILNCCCFEDKIAVHHKSGSLTLFVKVRLQECSFFVWSHILRKVLPGVTLQTVSSFFWKCHGTLPILTVADLNLPYGAEPMCNETVVVVQAFAVLR